MVHVPDADATPWRGSGRLQSGSGGGGRLLVLGGFAQGEPLLHLEACEVASGPLRWSSVPPLRQPHVARPGPGTSRRAERERTALLALSDAAFSLKKVQMLPAPRRVLHDMTYCVFAQVTALGTAPAARFGHSASLVCDPPRDKRLSHDTHAVLTKLRPCVPPLPRGCVFDSLSLTDEWSSRLP